MKIVITASEANPDSPVDPRFGRAAQFILHDTETGEFTVHDNAQNLNAPQGAGIQAAQTVANLGAEWVLTGHCGPKAFTVLQSAGIKIGVGVKGTVREVVELVKEGKIEAAPSADVEGHWV